jgi:hypothetical protein
MWWLNFVFLTKVSEVNNEVFFYLFYLLMVLTTSFVFFAVKIYHKEHKDLRKAGCLLYTANFINTL